MWAKSPSPTLALQTPSAPSPAPSARGGCPVLTPLCPAGKTSPRGITNPARCPRPSYLTLRPWARSLRTKDIFENCFSPLTPKQLFSEKVRDTKAQPPCAAISKG